MTLREVSVKLGISYVTVTRWHSRGLGGHRLAARRGPSGILTTDWPEVEAFLAAVGRTASASEGPGSRRRRDRAARESLRAMGV